MARRPLIAGTANFESDRSIPGQVWVEWTGSGGSFTIHRNSNIPVFPLTSEESEWVRRTIRNLFGLDDGT